MDLHFSNTYNKARSDRLCDVVYEYIDGNDYKELINDLETFFEDEKNHILPRLKITELVLSFLEEVKNAKL